MVSPNTSLQRFDRFGFLNKASRLPRLFRDLGTAGALRYLLQRAVRLGAKPATATKIDVFTDYAFLRAPTADDAVSVDLTAIPARTLNWVIPHFEAGSGGHMSIFRIIMMLEDLGYRSHIVIVGDTRFSDSAAARKVIHDHFLPLKAAVSLGEQSLQPAEFTVATEWRTAYSVRRYSATRHKLYFIQDMEPQFFPLSSHSAFAEATYRFGFTGITIGDWLAEQVRTRYGMDAYAFQMSYPKEQHIKPLPRRPGPRRVLFYARHVTPRRGFELGLLALNLIHKALPDIEFILLGWDVSNYKIPFVHLNAGVVPHTELADLYSQCDAALVLSLTNLSLLPLEIMACGCPVVSNRGPNVEWQLRDGYNALLADATPEALAEAVIRLFNDAELRQRLIDNGLAFAQQSDWALEGQRVAGYLEHISGRQPLAEADSGARVMEVGGSPA